MNWKKIAKCLRSKKWGQCRYSRTKGGWTAEVYCEGLYGMRWMQLYEDNEMLLRKTEDEIVSEITKARADACFKYYKKKTNKLWYKRRKWRYIP
jgi:hypothetical protein